VMVFGPENPETHTITTVMVFVQEHFQLHLLRSPDHPLDNLAFILR
jgi:hypothetical protein